MSPRRLLINAIAVTAIVAAGGIAFLRLGMVRESQDARESARAIAGRAARELERRVERAVAALDTAGRVLPADAAARPLRIWAEELAASDPIVGAVLVLAPDARVLATFPAAAEESRLRLPPDYLAAPAAFLGPVPLPASRRLSLLALTAIEAAPAERPLILALSLPIEALVAESGLGSLAAAGYEFRLEQIEANSRARAVARSSEREPIAPVSDDLRIGSRPWTLRVAPRAGWPSWRDRRAETAVMAIVALLAGLFTYDLGREPVRLRRTVEKGTERLVQVRRALDRAHEQRELAQAREAWTALDRFARMVVAVLVAEGEPIVEEEVIAQVNHALARADIEVRALELAAAVARLEERGLIERDEAQRLALARPALARLDETARPLAQIARDAMERIGAFRLERRLGGGGMGEVFRGVNVHDGSQAAVKLLYRHMVDDPSQKVRFKRESALVAEINHPNLVRFIESGEHNNQLYLAMELLDGETLAEVLDRGPLPLVEASRTALDLAYALAALHHAQVVHRDVKASNVMRTPDGRAVLLDLGLAVGGSTATLTATNSVLGTIPYMPPERLTGARGTPATDIWSTGIVFFEMLTGRLPWSRKGQLHLVNEITRVRAGFAFDAVREVTGHELAKVVDDMLDPDPETRIADGAELVRRLEAIGARASRATRRAHPEGSTPPSSEVSEVSEVSGVSEAETRRLDRADRAR